MITVFPGNISGRVKALHGVNLGPIENHWARDYSAYFKAAGIPSVRTHDASLKVADVVDLHCVFPNPAADPDDPVNYRFGLTDAYLNTIRDTGADIYLRLGESIDHTPHKLYIHPELWTPERLARVCVNIIRHYNHGWADGHQWGIRYVEFWNEPELGWDQEPAVRRMWTGTAEQFLDFYRAVAPAIRALEPAIRVGLAGFARPLFIRPKDDPDFVPGWSEMVEWCVNANLPVDFVSWHRYSRSWDELVQLSTAVRDYLDSLGLTDAENHLTEWHYLPLMQDARGPYTFMSARLSGDYERIEKSFDAVTDVAAAAFTFGALVRLQDASLDLAHHYTGIGGNFGLFTFSGRPNSVYEAFAAFHHISDDSNVRMVHVETSPQIDADAVAVLATTSASGQLKVGVAHMGNSPDDVLLHIESAVATQHSVSKAHRLDNTGWCDISAETSDGNTFTISTSQPGITILELTPH